MATTQQPSTARKSTRPSLSERAYLELKGQILDNGLSLGRQYMEHEIAERLNMSRTPIREALIRLANEGFVEIRPRHGMRIKPISREDMREIYEILTSLESQAAALAARRRPTDAELQALRSAVRDMDAALDADDLDAWAEADERFHRQLVGCSNNRRLIALVGTYMDQSHRVRMLTLRMRPRPVDSNQDHRAVVEAIARGDADEARRVHRTHREKSGHMLIELLSTHGMSEL